MMDDRSEQELVGVHPDLVKVLRATPQTPQPFVVIHGLRTEAEEAGMVAKAASQTMHSRHLKGKAGFACAIDFACLENGHVTWEPRVYQIVWGVIQATAKGVAIPIEWGGSWKTLKDWGHVQLPWLEYP